MMILLFKFLNCKFDLPYNVTSSSCDPVTSSSHHALHVLLSHLWSTSALHSGPCDGDGDGDGGGGDHDLDAMSDPLR
jgi:hypothetical protein